MLSWTWEFCLPDLVCFGITLVIVGYCVWVLAEQKGWEAGFMDAADMRDHPNDLPQPQIPKRVKDKVGGKS